MTLDRSRSLDLLTALYASEASAVLERLEAVLEKHRRRLADRPSPSPWTQADVFLITYPDQLRSPGRPPLQALAEFCRSHLKPTIGGLHLLPFFPSSSDDGFAVTDYLRVDPALGDWDDIHRLGRDFRLMVDLVLNHASSQGAWFDAFRRRTPPHAAYFLVPEPAGDWSRVVRPRTSPLFTDFETDAGPRSVWTTFGPDQVDLDYRQPAVLLEMVDILLETIGHGAQVIRLDAVGYLWKQPGTACIHLPQTHALVKLLRLATGAVAPWVRLITETNVPPADNIAYFGDGDEAHWVYQFALPPLVLQTLISGDARVLTDWAIALRPPPGGSTFFNFLASHDGIGLNGATGLLSDAQVAPLIRLAERCGAVSYRSDPMAGKRPYEMNVNLLDVLGEVPAEAPLPPWALARLVCAHAIMLSLAGIPAVTFHSLFGSRGDAPAVRRSGLARSINRQKFDRETLEAELRQPGTLRRRAFDALSRLIRARRSLAALHPHAPQRALDLPATTFGVERTSLDSSQRLLCLHEIAGQVSEVRLAPGSAAGWDVLGGENVRLEGVALAPYQVRWIKVVPW